MLLIPRILCDSYINLQKTLQVEHDYADSPRCHLLNVSKLAQALGALKAIGFVDGGGHELASRAQYNVNSNLSNLEILKRIVLQHTWTTYAADIKEIQALKKQKKQ